MEARLVLSAAAVLSQVTAAAALDAPAEQDGTVFVDPSAAESAETGTESELSVMAAADTTIINVTNAAELENAITNAVGGETILLATGSYGNLTIKDRNMPAEVTLQAADGAIPEFAFVKIQNSSKWRLDGLHVRPRITSSTSSSAVSLNGSDLIIENSHVNFADDVTGWSATDWVNRTSGGVGTAGSHITVRNNTIKNVSTGINNKSDHSLISGNTVTNFRGDGMRGLSDHTVFEYNVIKNSYKVDNNHDDGFQSWPTGPDGGFASGEVVGVTLRGNTFIAFEDPNQPFRSDDLQGIGMFDGIYRDWVIENNVVINNHTHGISVFGAIDVNIVNNTVIDIDSDSGSSPRIMITDHKDGTPSENSIIRNNLAPLISAGTGVTADHNLIVSDPSLLFVDPTGFDLHLKEGAAAIDAGSSELAPPVDRDGTARPLGAAVDIGAYEYDDGVARVSTPTITPGGGIFEDAVEVTVATDTPDATLYYTLDGTTPTESSTLYTGSLTLTADATVKVRAFKDGLDPSPVASADFVISAPTVSTPTITPGGGTFVDSVEVTLATDTPDATLYYTLDGTTPTESSLLYTGPLTLTDSATVKVRGFLVDFDPSPVASMDFTVLSSDGERVSDDLLVLYEFAEGSGNTVTDTSGVGTPLNLTIGNTTNATWAHEVLTIDASTLISTGGPATKIFEAVTASNAITIEAWIIPANTTQNGPARIVTMSADISNRNFTLGQGTSGSTGDRYETRLRTTATNDNGSSPALESPGGSLTGQLQHVVYTRDAAGNAKLYIDSVEVVSATISGDLSNWDSTYEFALANELTGDRPWLGTFDLVALYGDALTSTEVAQNYLAGPVINTAPAVVTAINGSSSNANRSGISTLAVTFDQSVDVVGVSSLQLFNHTTVTAIDLSAAVLIGNGTSTVTWDFAELTLPNGRYTAELPRDQVTTDDGQPLQTSHTFEFHVLRGDVNGDGRVNSTDFIVVDANFDPLAGTPFRAGDANGDGLVNSSDFIYVDADFNPLELAPLAYDFGDAPESETAFPTTLANNGARHVQTGNTLYLGADSDAELDGQPTIDASGDGADEDGVSVDTLVVGTNVAVAVTSSGPGVVNGWIDFNQDGDWDDPGEQVFHNEAVVAGTNKLQITVPAEAVLGSTFARFRLTETTGYSYFGLAPNGEIEDYQLTVADLTLDSIDTASEQSLATTSSREALTPSWIALDGFASGHSSLGVSGGPTSLFDRLFPSFLAGARSRSRLR